MTASCALRGGFPARFSCAFYLMILLLLCACASDMRQGLPPVSPLADESPAATAYFEEYRLRGGDVLDIIYEIHPLKTAEYRLNIEDVVDVRFPSLPDHDTQQTIRSDGMISLPYIGDVHAEGMTPGEMTAHLQDAYKKILRFPDVYVSVRESGSGLRELRRIVENLSQGQSRLQTIRLDGLITFPLIGDMAVAGKSVPELSEMLNQACKTRYPELSAHVRLSKSAGLFVYVLGEVERPGAYEISRPVNITQALALAGGPTFSAKLAHVALSRRKGPDMECSIIDMEDGFRGESAVSGNLLVPDDIIYVPRHPLANAAQIAREIADLTFFRGFSLGASWKLDE